ncbi:hypothetical protein E5S70_35275 [Ensifer adhaerens]|nr:hypothetical protein [Ensifer canadensis]
MANSSISPRLCWLKRSEIHSDPELQPRGGKCVVSSRLPNAAKRASTTSRPSSNNGGGRWPAQERERRHVRRVKSQGVCILDYCDRWRQDTPRRFQMDITTLLIIVLIVLVLTGGFYGRGRWY